MNMIYAPAVDTGLIQNETEAVSAGSDGAVMYDEPEKLVLTLYFAVSDEYDTLVAVPLL